MCEKNEAKQMVYKCAICDKVYDSIQERAQCEMTCVKHKQEEERKAAEAKKKQEKNARFSEASAALDNALTLVNKCVEDYGSFEYNGKVKELDLANMDFFPSKLWHHFWF